MSLRHGIGLAGVLVLSSCGARRVTGPEPSAPAPATMAGPSSVEPPDDGRLEISGRLRAHDGTALRRAEVVVRRADFREPVATVAVDDEGRFQIDVAPGVYQLSIAAVDHRRALRTTVVAEALRVEGRLGTYDRVEPGDALTIRSELVDAAGAIVGRGPTSAARVADRVYRLDLSGKPPEAVALRYQLVAGGGQTYNGPLADRHESDGGGDFWSIVDVSGKDALELDLRALPEPGKAPQLQWTGETEPTAALLGFRERWIDAIDDIYARMPRKDGKIATMTDELRAEATALASKARAEVDAAADPTTRALLRMEHLSLFGMFIGTMSDAAALREEVMGSIEHLSPVDPHLTLLLNLDNVLYAVRRDADEAVLARTEAWLERCARENPEPSVSLDALTLLLHTADERHDDARVTELYALVLDPRFEGTYGQTSLVQRHDPDRILKRGKPFPAFDFEVIGGDGGRVTSTGLAGRVYLLEFWATWCGPCVGEMPKLHATYSAINGAKPGKGRGEKGLRRLAPAKRPRVEFVFVSLDDDPSQVEAFRKQHWSMPWTHAFVGRAGEAEAMKRFGFSGVPTAVLVDETGTILEVDAPLRRDALLPTLERVLAERRPEARR